MKYDIILLQRIMIRKKIKTSVYDVVEYNSMYHKYIL